jgi:hypothetical protein
VDIYVGVDDAVVSVDLVLGYTDMSRDILLVVGKSMFRGPTEGKRRKKKIIRGSRSTRSKSKSTSKKKRRKRGPDGRYVSLTRGR